MTFTRMLMASFPQKSLAIFSRTSMHNPLSTWLHRKGRFWINVKYECTGIASMWDRGHDEFIMYSVSGFSRTMLVSWMISTSLPWFLKNLLWIWISSPCLLKPKVFLFYDASIAGLYDLCSFQTCKKKIFHMSYLDSIYVAQTETFNFSLGEAFIK